MTNVDQAELFAYRKHAGQTYGELQPYFTHLAAVVKVLKRYGVTDENLLAAGWLHDVVEDHDVEVGEIADRFGTEVAVLVWAVTNGPGKNRASRYRWTYKRIAMIPGAVTLKLADRIANVEQCIKDGARGSGHVSHTSLHSSIFQMYQSEHEGFRAALHSGVEDNRDEEMWAYLDWMLTAQGEAIVAARFAPSEQAVEVPDLESTGRKTR